MLFSAITKWLRIAIIILKMRALPITIITQLFTKNFLIPCKTIWLSNPTRNLLIKVRNPEVMKNTCTLYFYKASKSVRFAGAGKCLQLLILFLLIVLPPISQGPSKYKGFPTLIWPKLYDIRFEKSKDDLGEFDKPIFSAAAKSLNGKTISLPGYVVPFDNGMKSNHFMFTSLPLNACFFCGVGGPETVVEVYCPNPVNYSEKPIEIKGILKLNSTNPDKMIYVIENAEILGTVDF